MSAPSEGLTIEKGVLVTCDVATREYILFLNEKEPFVLKEVDETHLLIAENAVERVKVAITENFERNIFLGAEK